MTARTLPLELVLAARLVRLAALGAGRLLVLVDLAGRADDPVGESRVSRARRQGARSQRGGERGRRTRSLSPRCARTPRRLPCAPSTWTICSKKRSQKRARRGRKRERERDAPDERVEFLGRRELHEQVAVLLLDVEGEDLVLVVVEAVAVVEAEVALVERARDVEVPVGVVADDAVLEDEGALVCNGDKGASESIRRRSRRGEERGRTRAHLLRREVALARDVEDGELCVVAVPDGAARRVGLVRRQVVDGRERDVLPLRARRADVAVDKPLPGEVFGPVRRALLAALDDELRADAALVRVGELLERLAQLGVPDGRRPLVLVRAAGARDAASARSRRARSRGRSGAHPMRLSISASRSAQMPSSSSMMILRSLSMPPSKLSTQGAVRCSLSAVRM